MQPNIDCIIGNNIRRHRHRLALSQKQLAQHLGISSQQLQKYEKGVNQMSASRLYFLSILFGCTMDAFCTDIKEFEKPLLPSTRSISIDKLLLDFINIDDSDIRRKIRNLIRALAAYSRRANE